MKKFFKRLFSVLLVIGFGLFGLYTAIVVIDKDLEFGDSFALFGGDLERGYPSAGYLISYEQNGNFKTCGYAALSSKMAVTASHCVDNSKRIEIGKGDFNLSTTANLQVVKAVQKEGWVDGKERVDDFAILIFQSPSGYFTGFADVGTPEVGCNYRIVAYGRTEDDFSAGNTRPRKSAKMCAQRIDGKIFYITGADKSGICFGDSGSPVYIDGTNQLVGVVASIVNDSSTDPSSPCSYGNQAIVVRADLNQDLLDQNAIVADNLVPGQTDVSEGLVIEVAEKTLLDTVGLSSLTTSERQRLIMYAAAAGGIFFLLIFLIIIYNERSSRQTDDILPQMPPGVTS